MIALFPTREIALSVGQLSIHWYGLMYLLAFSLVLLFIPRLQHFRSLTLSKDAITSIVTWAIAGVIIGGRLGYVLFYEFSYFVENPLSVFAVWNGGMSSHGGFIGVSVAVWYALRKYSVPILPFLDVITVPVALGLALGRFGNYINLELYGSVTTLPWGMEIPGVEGLRHPTQIYAVIKNCSIAFLCFVLLSNKHIKPGIAFSVFLILYAIFRSIVELFRVPTHSELEFIGITLTRGQALSLPVLFAGLLLLLYVRLRESL